GRLSPAVGCALLLLGAVSRGAAAETIKLGTAKIAATGPIYIAQAKGYFAAEGLTLEIKYVDVAQGIAIASNKADGAGLKTFDDLGGHVLGNTQAGSAFQYILSLIAAKRGIDLKSSRFVPLQSLPN